MPCLNHPEIERGLARCTRCNFTFCPNCVVRIGGEYYCGNCKGEQVRDLQSGTAAGGLELASVGRRFVALWLDSMLMGIIFVAALMAYIGGLAALSRLDQAEPGDWVFLAIGLGTALVMLIYEGVMLQLRGQTLGKIALGIEVVTPSGEEISAGQAWGRALLRQVFFSYASVINYLPAWFTKERTCVHDLVARTRVARVRF